MKYPSRKLKQNLVGGREAGRGEGAWRGGVTWDPEVGNSSFTFKPFFNFTVSSDQ